ncbi:hypothetical protein A0H81_13895 [Grifola frondosa]|uniref:Uncharacterized protein n=1 Tax=Grifola frondosa TaxID=5627 RepID=A0A1C7LNA8_GRIFR|nr:hypothetical protein A0H81_13895 [Grifola frondosa]
MSATDNARIMYPPCSDLNIAQLAELFIQTSFAHTYNHLWANSLSKNIRISRVKGVDSLPPDISRRR